MKLSPTASAIFHRLERGETDAVGAIKSLAVQVRLRQINVESDVLKITRWMSSQGCKHSDADPDNLLLHQAAALGWQRLASWILEEGVSPDAPHPEGVQLAPLHMAAFNGHTKMINLLVSNGASVDIRDKQEETPLFWAATGSRPQALACLIGHGADPLHLPASGRCALMLCFEDINPEDPQVLMCVEMLLDAGVDADRCDDSGQCAWDWANAYPGMQDKLGELIADRVAAVIENGTISVPLVGGKTPRL